MKFLELVTVFEELENTSKRLEKTSILAEFLKKSENIEQSLLLLQGIVFPIYSPNKLGIAKKSLLKTISSAFGVSESKIQGSYDQLGDIGLVAEKVAREKTQMTLASFAPKEPLDITKVFDNLQRLVLETGDSSTNRKSALIIELLTNSTPTEAKYITRLASGDLRIGISTGTIRDAIQKVFLPTITNLLDTEEQEKVSGEEVTYDKAITLTEDKYITAESYEDARKIYVLYSNLLQHAIDKVNDMGKIATIAKEKGIKGISEVTIELNIPCRVMLMQKVKTVEEGIEKIPTPLALEYKYDGFRGIVHKKGESIKIFTRSLEEVSTQFPDVVESLQKNILVEEAIIDGEILGLRADGSYVPFQEVSQRIKRKHNIHELVKKLPVAYITWDIIYKNGKELIHKPMQERRKILVESISETKTFHSSNQKIINSREEGEIYYRKSLAEGNEGVVLKDLQGTYQPGNRVGCWLKLKPIMDPLDVVIIGAQWGEGKRASWLTSYVIAIRKEDEFVSIGKVGTGFKELTQEEGVTFNQMTELLRPLIITDEKGEVTVKPEIVIAVNYEEIQKSTSYSSGFALRFPRLLTLRDDLDVQEIDDITKVKDYFDSQ